MSIPLTADRLLDVLRDAGLKVVEHRNWRTHNRNGKGPWGPVHGVMIHHTVTQGTAHTVDLCYNGYSSLPGPLCHGVIAKDGTIYLVGNGRTNHAGKGDRDVFNAVRAESYVTRPPADNGADMDGNAHFYGFECENLGDGQDPWPAVQLEAIERAAAAICKAHGWNHRSVIGHLEWQPGKVDPRGFTMPAMRERIKERIDAPAPKPKPKPRPRYEPYPGASFFRTGRSSAIVTAMGRRLVAEGCSRYRVGPGPNWSEADRQSYAAWQRKCGYSGDAADGIPGRASWEKLKVPQV
jgi:hypothetical protein